MRGLEEWHSKPVDGKGSSSMSVAGKSPMSARFSVSMPIGTYIASKRFNEVARELKEWQHQTQPKGGLRILS